METSSLEELAQTIAKGFQYLLYEVATLSEQHRFIEAKLSHAHDQYVELNQQSQPSDHGHPLQEALNSIRGQNRKPNPHAADQSSVSILIQAQKATDAVLKSQNNTAASHAPKQCPLSKPTDMERDFTTQGAQGNLQCPFAANVARPHGLPTPPVFPATANGIPTDPIAAEFHPDARSSSATSTSHANNGKCPIRFLERHSPQEVAQYFENHKHEIPRSHEICVRRYQKNSESIRQLDAKYGNLVSMIQGLGVKHKQYLPEDKLNDARESETKNGEAGSGDKVTKWAEDVSHRSIAAESHDVSHSVPVAKIDESANNETRSPRFERPLRPIRVGESPSRPWGISVPVASLAAGSVGAHNEAASSIPAPVPGNIDDERPPRKDEATVSCLQTDNKQEESDARQTGSRSQSLNARPARESKPAQLIFNGPTFFGYSPDQISQMMHSGTF
ncbi:MAG: hypothetical protein Q9227_000423 [Pyrenula ochraceoflavens]